MASITVQDITTEAEFDIADSSILGRLGIHKLVSKAHDFVSGFSTPLGEVQFNSSAFSVDGPVQSFPLKDGFSLKFSEKTNSCLTLYKPSDKALFGTDDIALSIPIKRDQYWLCFELGSDLDAGVGGAIPGDPAGFGVALDQTKAVKFRAYTLFDSAAAALPTFKDAIQTALVNFTIPLTAQAVRNEKLNIVHGSSVAGTLKLSGSYSLPISANGLSLAEARIPITVDLESSVKAKLTGSISIIGEFDVRTWKQNETTLIFAVYKKRGTTLALSFDSSAGVAADAFKIDLASKILTAVSPKIDDGLLTDRAIAKVVSDSVERSIAISLNASLSESVADESALVYRIDLVANSAATDKAIDEAFAGDWTGLSTLENVTELKNAIRHAVEQKSKLSINLLGLYNHESVSDFVKSSTILHSPEDGSLTITDRVTAKLLAIASEPFVADRKRLRKALDDATISTAAYSFAQTGNFERFDTKQTLVVYQEEMDRATLLKKLKLGVALNVLSESEIEAKVNSASEYHQVLIETEQHIDADAARNMFFDDAAAHTPRNPTELANRGRRIISEFLDPADPIDAHRLAGLRTGWDPSETPADPLLYPDWIDIMWWASSISNVAKPLSAVMDAFAKLPMGSDPSDDPDFMHKRADLTSALAKVAKATHSAFEEGWSLALTNDIAGGQTRADVRVSWNGQVQLEGSTKNTAATAGSAA